MWSAPPAEPPAQGVEAAPVAGRAPHAQRGHQIACVHAPGIPSPRLDHVGRAGVAEFAVHLLGEEPFAVRPDRVDPAEDVQPLRRGGVVGVDGPPAGGECGTDRVEEHLIDRRTSRRRTQREHRGGALGVPGGELQRLHTAQ